MFTPRSGTMALLGALSLSACGGGGSTSSTPAVSTTPAPHGSPTVSPSPRPTISASPVATPTIAPVPTQLPTISALPTAVPTSVASQTPVSVVPVPAPATHLSLFALNGTFLGNLYSDALDNCYSIYAIGNRFSQYGSQFAAASIWNQFDTYGSPYNSLSAYDPYTSTPPALVNSASNIVAYVSKNRFLAIPPSALLDPDTIQTYLEQQCGVVSYR